jgi:hypothetical protein
MTAEHVEKGGAWFLPGASATWPFITLRASPDRIQIQGNVLGIWHWNYEFSRLEIKSIKKQSGLMTKGIRIQHSKTDYPSVVIFWTFDYNALKQVLNTMGYGIDES